MSAKSSTKKATVKSKVTKSPAKKEAQKPHGKAPAAAKKAASTAAPKSSAPAATRAAKPGAAPQPARAAKKAETKKPVSRLGKKDLDVFRKLLLEKQEEFTESYKVSKGDSRSTLDNGTEDYIDYAVSSYAKEFLLSLSELDRKQLLLVQEALRRVDRGVEFGLCLQCGQEIPRKRLEVAPWVRHCVRCQELEEQGLLPQSPFPGDAEDGQDDALGLDEEYEGPLPAEEEEDEEADEEEEPIEADDSLVIEGEEE